MTTLDITCLRSLVTVASFGGVRKAADALHLSQAAVSGHLRRLEGQLGFPVVARQGRNIAFTSRGEDVLREAYRLLGEHDDALRRLLGPGAGDLVVVSTEHATEPLLRAVGQVLSRDHPDRPVRFRFHRSARVREFVHDHSADVALGIGDLGHGTRHIADLPLAWAGPADRAPEPDKIVAFTAPCAIRERILASEAAAGRPPARECVDLLSLLAAVRTTGGITALPLTRDQEQGLRRLDTLPPLPAIPLSLVTSDRLATRTREDIASVLYETRRTYW
ncbi:LysR family transcriptional regulator [Streptomyces sp. RY43-2]|uniref:LysR family transcriptional regulator n=1 Tax=Streptomyces macrolidinus TaxID=2952607 RepID=A0ABT0ZB41_9ACTN|nr:LysR family transcriptional regulator [Streptomyces macrolidinus]MCN9240994.1 LysR family transcriptional regulator [Streptomyces macrolidinus]